jgi:hypothetical protein
VLAFFIVIACMVLLVRYMVQLEKNKEAQARWSRRKAFWAPFARHAKADAQAVAWHVRHWRSIRRFRKGL